MLLPADIISALKARWRLELAIVAVVLALVIAWTLVTPRSYEATASLLFDARPLDPTGTDGAQQEGAVAQIATQSDVIQSEAIATEVSRSLQLAASPGVVAGWRQSTGGTGDIDAWYGRQLLTSLDVVPVAGSRVMSIKYKAADPEFAAQVANGFVSSYLAAKLRQDTDPARTYSRWFVDRTKEVRAQLEAAQAKLTAFQRKTGIVDSGEANAEQARLAELSSQLTGAEAASADLTARSGSNASASPDVQASSVVQQLRSSIAAKSAEISQLSADLGPNHPTRQAAEAELAALNRRLAIEVGTTTRSVRVASGAAGGKEADLRQMLGAQRGRMLSLATDRAQLDVLQRDVASARAAYDAVTMRLSTMRLQSAAPTANATQLDVATPPLFPSSPNVFLRVLLGFILGMVLAIATAIALEAWRPRVRTAKGASSASGVPVIGLINFGSSRAGALIDGKAAA